MLNFAFTPTRLHRVVLGATAVVIILFQTGRIFDDAEEALNGIDWILAYVAAAGLLILATPKSKPSSSVDLSTPHVPNTESVIRAILAEAKHFPPRAMYRAVAEATIAKAAKYAKGSRQDIMGALHIEEASPEQLAVRVLFNFAHEELTSGQLHTYRGVLSQEGKFLNEFAHHLLKRRVELRELDEDAREKESLALQESLRNVG